MLGSSEVALSILILCCKLRTFGGQEDRKKSLSLWALGSFQAFSSHNLGTACFIPIFSVARYQLLKQHLIPKYFGCHNGPRHSSPGTELWIVLLYELVVHSYSTIEIHLWVWPKINRCIYPIHFIYCINRSIHPSIHIHSVDIYPNYQYPNDD